MPLVIDASIAAAWLLPEETSEVAERALQALASDTALALRIWWFDVRNVLIVNERRKRIGTAQTEQALRLLRKLPIMLDSNPSEPRILDLARRHGLTVYDAAYLELAAREGLALVSLDRELCRSARSEKLMLFGEGGWRAFAIPPPNGSAPIGS